MKKFEDFNLKPEVREYIALNHFREPTPIQEEVIPAVIRGKDVIGLSATGSGKTHAYLIPIMQKINPELDCVQAVITAPTRELAYQIYEMAKSMGDCMPQLRVRIYTGGRDREKDRSQDGFLVEISLQDDS